METKGGALLHREFLAEEGKDPRRELAQRLCADIPKNVCVLAYNMGFEKGRIKELAKLFDDLSAHLMKIHDNIKDLMQPFQKRAYYCREMGGSYSIKQVLPALCPDEAELDYHALDLIHNGEDAMTAYTELPGKSPEERRRIRAALLAYCRLDTLAMVKILERLFEEILQESQSLQEMATLRKFSSLLPSNLYLDDSMSYKRSQHPNQKRIKFQPDKGDKAINGSFLEMRFDGDIDCLNSPASLNHLELSRRDVNKIKQFVLNNVEALETLADMDIEIEDFKRIMIVGGKPATLGQKNKLLLDLQLAKEEFKKRKN